mmetsp:Transcript_43718/g.91931  ORF Transcript_43718/g.91931 Transcript_43718/m.91931 type:complete len:246 (-) Transcript_43718:11-748(-)
MLPNFQHLVIGTLNATISGTVKHRAACNCASAHLDKVSNDGEVRVVAKGNNLLMDHESKDTHHGGTAVVELNGTLGELGLLIKVIPSEVNVSVTEVTNVLVSSSRNITHEGALQPSDEGKDLDKSSSGDGVRSEEGGNTVGERVKGVSGVVDGSGEVDSSTGHDLSKEGKLSDTAVLDLDVTKAVETFLGAVSREHAEGIVESKRRLGTELILEGVELGGGLAGLGGGESGGGADKGGDDGGLHV